MISSLYLKKSLFFSYALFASCLTNSLLLADSSTTVSKAQAESSEARADEIMRSKDLLVLSDVKPVVDQMLKLHIRYHSMSQELFIKVIQQYFAEFDSRGLYLLPSEMQTYTKISQASIKAQIDLFQKGDYSFFEDLDRVIQKSIWRARQLAGELKNSKEAPNLSNLKKGNAFKEMEIKWRQFINSGEYDASIDDLKAVENEYLYLDQNGKALSLAQRDHFRSLHILKAVASGLDAHSGVFSKQEAQSIKQSLDTQYIGLGLVLARENHNWYVKSLLPNSPASRSGQIQPGDKLVQIDQNLLKGRDDDLKLLQKAIGEKVALVFDRKGARVQVSLEMASIENSQDRVRVQEKIVDGGKRIGYLAMDSFYEGDNSKISSEADIARAIESFKKEGVLDGLILDLRRNLGGYLDQAVKVVGLFITNGVVVISKYSDGSVAYYRDMDPSQAFVGPVVVLTSRMSASAAEIVAQSLQDYGVALVVGDHTTYGKGSIQSHTFGDKDAQAYYKLTVGRYYTVSGKSTQLDGVGIDIVVPGPYDKLSIGERFQNDPLTPDSVSAAFKDSFFDLNSQEKPWMIQHYLPTLQTKSTKWQALLPKLRESSQRRQDSFFKDKPMESRSDQELWDMQNSEDYEIVREMIKYK